MTGQSTKMILIILWVFVLWAWHLFDLIKRFKSGWFYKNNLFFDRDAKVTRAEHKLDFWTLTILRTFATLVIGAGLLRFLIQVLT